MSHLTFWLAIAGMLIIADIVVIAAIYSLATRHHRFVPDEGIPAHWGGLSRDKTAYSADGDYRTVPPIEYWDQFFLVEDGERSPKDFG